MRYAVILILISSCSVAQAAKVFVSSTPKKAAIIVDDKDSGKKTPAIIDLPAGKAAIILKLNGYEDWKTDLVVKGGPLQKIKATFKKQVKVKPTSTFSIMVLEPEECFVYINSKQLVKDDGKPYLTPVEIPGFPVGKYRVTISKRGYKDLIISGYVLGEKTKSVEGTLRKGRSMLIGRNIPTITLGELKNPRGKKRTTKKKKRIVLVKSSRGRTGWDNVGNIYSFDIAELRENCELKFWASAENRRGSKGDVILNTPTGSRVIHSWKVDDDTIPVKRITDYKKLTPISYDISKHVTKAGTHKVHFKYRGGSDAYVILRVEIILSGASK